MNQKANDVRVVSIINDISIDHALTIISAIKKSEPDATVDLTIHHIMQVEKEK